MELTREQKRLLMLHEYKLGSNAAEAARQINEAWGDGTVGVSTVRERFREFKAGNEDLGDQPREGRPQEVDRQAVLEAIEENPSLTTRMLAGDFDCSHMTICRILHELEKTCRKTKWVPHELNEAQKAKRVGVSGRLFNRYSHEPLFLHDIITMDEKWVAFDNPHKHNEWLSPNQQASSTPVKDFRKDKRMLVVFWNRGGIVHYELLAKGQTMTADLYCRILRRVHRRLGYRQRVVLQHDNARPHTANVTKKLLEEEFGWEILEHPPYSPDLAPSDYHLFRSMEHALRNKKFQSIVEMENFLINFFNSKDPEFYARGIDLLPEKWQEVIEVDGEYFDY